MKLKDILKEHAYLGELPTSKLKKMKWNPVLNPKRKDEAVKLVDDKRSSLMTGTSLNHTFDKKGHDIAMKWLKKNKVRSVLSTLKDKYSEAAIISIDGRKYTIYAKYGQLRIGGGGKLGNTWRKGDEVELLKQMQENKILEWTTQKTHINEEYVEIMDGLNEGLSLIGDAWKQWKNGPMTEKGDIKPAQKELMGYVNSWLKKNIK